MDSDTGRTVTVGGDEVSLRRKSLVVQRRQQETSPTKPPNGPRFARVHTRSIAPPVPGGGRQSPAARPDVQVGLRFRGYPGPMQGRAQSLPQVLSLLGAFVATAMVMGVLMAGLLIPGAYATGAATNSSIAAFDDLPSEFTTTALAQQSVILDVNGGVIATPYDENRIIIGLDEVAPIMKTAILAIEDSRFYEHNGVDLRGMSWPSSEPSGQRRPGCPMITQQYVKPPSRRPPGRPGTRRRSGRPARRAIAARSRKPSTRCP